mmetsp:Transcript_12577/g.23684  ORF Transcript_12577/g.23684 Transcript_12577/m.23684 type:complete len:297 (-) Transcript_12577:34-924(-)
MLLARHRDHPAALPLENAQEIFAAALVLLLDRTLASLPLVYSHLVVHQRQVLPASFPAIRTKHRMRAQYVKLFGYRSQEQPLRELFHGKHVHHKRISLQSQEWKLRNNGLSGQNACAEDYNLRVFLTKIVHTLVIFNAKLFRYLVILVRPGRGHDLVALRDHPAREKLAERPEPHYPYLQLRRRLACLLFLFAAARARNGSLCSVFFSSLSLTLLFFAFEVEGLRRVKRHDFHDALLASTRRANASALASTAARVSHSASVYEMMKETSSTAEVRRAPRRDVHVDMTSECARAQLS